MQRRGRGNALNIAGWQASISKLTSTHPGQRTLEESFFRQLSFHLPLPDDEERAAAGDRAPRGHS